MRTHIKLTVLPRCVDAATQDLKKLCGAVESTTDGRFTTLSATFDGDPVDFHILKENWATVGVWREERGR